MLGCGSAIRVKFLSLQGLSFYFNAYDHFAGSRSRETTPCNLIMDSNMIASLGSTTTHNHSNYHGNVVTLIRSNDPDLAKFNELFDAKTRQYQCAFSDKYNFDPVNDCPLPGRFEWVKLK
ncbi:hypothetical protein EJB05_22023, partial [Eragrostis curvula]